MESSAAIASGWLRVMVSGSSFLAFSSPNALAAAICSRTAWLEEPTPGMAILLPGPKSATDRTFGSRVTSTRGSEL